MTTLTIDVPRPEMTANDQRRWTWPQVRRAKLVMAAQVTKAALTALASPQTEQIAVRVTWYPKDRIRRDADALGPFVKSALDALVAMRIIPDDSREHVASVTTAIGAVDKTRPRIVIELVPAAACWVCGENRPPPTVCSQQCHATDADHELADTFTRKDHR